MEYDLHQAFYGVFCSSKEILKSNQRHLYINMLDLLGRTCKATGLAEDKIGKDNLVQFWLADILPLIFDNDPSIQSCAVIALEQGLQFLEPSVIHKSKNWPELRSNIVEEMPEKLQKLRETKNKHWNKIWCFIIKILDQEILKGASIINSFLSVVELGFRSSDSNVRAEAFACWRLLITIFTKHNELLTPKRLKLICIPLKSSQSKSYHSANVKLRVWWYFITCINGKLDTHFESAVEPFLSFVFGSTNGATTGAVQQYTSLKTVSVLCLAQLLLEEEDIQLAQMLGDHNLEILNFPSAIMNSQSLTKYWSPLIHSIFNAIRILFNCEKDEDYGMYQYLLNMFLLRLTGIMVQLNYGPSSQAICDGLIQLLPSHKQPLKTALNYFADTGFVKETLLNNIENLSGVLNPLISLIIAGKPFITPDILQRCIEQFTKICEIPQEEQQWRILSTLIKTVTTSKEDDGYEAFEIRLLCWRYISRILLRYLRENNLKYRRREFAEIINVFILWPLNQLISFTGSFPTFSFDDDFCALWRQLLLSGQNAPGRDNFLDEIRNELQELSKKSWEDLPLAELVDAYVAAVMKLTSLKDSTYIVDFFKFLDDLLSRPLIATSKTFEQYLNTLHHFLLHLKDHELTNSFDVIKSVISHIVSIVSKEKCVNPKFFDDWKQGLMERFRLQSQKALTSQIREVLKGSDLFVIIPSVWMLNPEKLTERQKERFAERSDIPALYNDMSQSQDSSIKPWTPNKIVIAKKDQTEIIISSSETYATDNEYEDVHSKKNNEYHLSTEKLHLCKSATKSNDKLLEDSMKLRSSKISLSIEKDTLKSTCYKEEDLTSEPPVKRNRKSLKNKTGDVEQKLDETNYRTKEENDQQPSEDVKSDTPVISLRKIRDSSMGTELSTTAKASNPEAQSENRSTSLGNDRISGCIQDKCSTGNTDSVSMQMTLDAKEISPKKNNSKIIPTLSSPPDRKFTNNSCSPSLRPKPTPHLTRGAQLINMIRSKKKVDGPSNCLKPLISSRTSIQAAKIEKREFTPTSEVYELDSIENAHTPVQNKDLLTFTKRLPSPSASPSASILKRKLRRDSFDEAPGEFPVSKRKRVSFHDPPVSITKEYVRDAEDSLVKTKRCLSLEKADIAQSPDIKHKKLSSMIDVQNCGDDRNETNNIPQTLHSQKVIKDTTDYNDSELNEFNSETLQSPILDKIGKENPLDVETALKMVVKECSLESVLESYFLTDIKASMKPVDTLAKILCKFMSTNSKVKTRVLEILSENHSKDFLDYALQENLSSVVCDRLNLNSVIEYIFAKSKLNSSCRNSLLLGIPEILRHCKIDAEPINFIETLIKSLNPSDGHILDLITILMGIRSTSFHPEIESTDVSSSNL